jgi:hypothetical protein
VAFCFSGIKTKRKPRTMQQTYCDYGSIEGILGKYTICEALRKQDIPCVFNDGLEDTASRVYGKRVYLFGRITYDSDGRPVNIHVQEIDVFPDEKDLPTFAEVQGILKGERLEVWQLAGRE